MDQKVFSLGKVLLRKLVAPYLVNAAIKTKAGYTEKNVVHIKQAVHQF